MCRKLKRRYDGQSKRIRTGTSRFEEEERF